MLPGKLEPVTQALSIGGNFRWGIVDPFVKLQPN